MRKLAKQTIKKWLQVLLHTKDSPERTAAAFALGVFIAFLPPVPWFHTVFALLLAFTFRLNRLAVLAGTYVNSPFTIAPLVLLEVRVGATLLRETMERPDLSLRQFGSAQGWKDAFEDLYPYFGPLILGSVLLGLVGAGIAYLVALNLIRVYRRRLAVAAAAAAAAAATAVAHAAQHAADAAAAAAAHATQHAAEAAKAAEEARAEAGHREPPASGSTHASSRDTSSNSGEPPSGGSSPHGAGMSAAAQGVPETRS